MIPSLYKWQIFVKSDSILKQVEVSNSSSVCFSAKWQTMHYLWNDLTDRSFLGLCQAILTKDFGIRCVLVKFNSWLLQAA
jgi:hypothetical protein